MAELHYKHGIHFILILPLPVKMYRIFYEKYCNEECHLIFLGKNIMFDS